RLGEALRIGRMGFWAGVTAFAATVAYDIVQILQVVGLLHFPLDDILIYGTSLCIVVPFVLEILALHESTDITKRFWTHAANLHHHLRRLWPGELRRPAHDRDPCEAAGRCRRRSPAGPNAALTLLGFRRHRLPRHGCRRPGRDPGAGDFPCGTAGKGR